MADPSNDQLEWETNAIASLRDLKLDETPGLELQLIDALARWCVSDSNPGRDYDEQHAAIAITALLSAVESASSYEGTVRPEATEEITTARTQVVAGAHALADMANGLTLLITRLMPAALGELTGHAGNPGAQVAWLYCYSLLAVASGRSSDIDEAVLRGLMASFDAWDALMADGFVPPGHPDEPVVPGDSPGQHGTRIDAAGAQGVQVGDLNIQENKFISQYVETQVVQVQSAPVTWPVRVGDVPQQPPAWQPREDLLAAVSKEGPGVPVVRAVTGMRGSGKTQVAAAYARSRIADGWRLVAWVNAGDMTKVLSGLGSVAARLGVRNSNEDLVSAAAAVRYWLEASGEGCLVIFDDAGDLDGLRPFVPAAGDAQIIITSSRQAAADMGLPVPVEAFTEEEALTFLAERTRNSDSDGARALAAELGRLPLALAQAAAVIARQRLRYTTYLDRLQMLPVGDYLSRVEADPYPRGAAAAILLSVESAGARDRSALPGAVLDLVAVLSTTGVNRKLLYAAGEAGALSRAMDAVEAPTEVDAALAQLADASLLTFSMDGSSVGAHRLIMRVIRELRAHDGSLAETGTAVARLLFAVSDSLKPIWQNPDAARDLIEHIMALCEHLIPLLTEVDRELMVNLLVLRERAVSYLTELGDSPSQEIRYIQPILAEYEPFLGPDDPTTMRMRSNLAGAYLKAGRIAEAIPLSERTLADQERFLGADHPVATIGRNNLARAYQLAGRLAEAIPLYERTLAEKERLFGSSHPDTLLAQNNLATAYQEADRSAEAIRLFERTLAERERVLGGNHPDTLLSQNNLAAAYQEADRMGEAIPLYERALAEQEGLLRGDHPDTLALRNNLAHAYQAVGRLPEAIQLYEQTLADCGRVLGIDHPNTRLVRQALAAARRSMG
jgi:tetratricopeptide (TPR) repeat protein